MAQAAPTLRRKRPWALSLICLLAAGGLVSMPILAGRLDGGEMPDIVRFIGHFHPLLLHLPIGVFALILFQELGAIFGRGGRTQEPSSLFPMFFGVASAMIAAIAGFLLFHGHGDEYGGNALAGRHLWGGLVFAVAAVLTFMVKAWTVSLEANPAWYRLLLFSTVGVMGFAGHDGASLTHGSDYLTRYAPGPLRGLLGLAVAKPADAAKNQPVAAADRTVYADIVAPILERRCVSCHKEGKAKGKLRVDTYEMLVKGGKDGPGIEPGNAAKSHIIERMELPEDDDERMPPAGKPGVEDAELRVIKWWLATGADPRKKLAEFETPPDIKEALAKLANAAPAKAVDDTGHAPPPPIVGPDHALKSAVDDLSKQFPGTIAFESMESPRVIFTAVSLRGGMDDVTFVKLTPVLSHLVTADFSSTKITDKSVAALECAKQLRMIRLAETGITDLAINTLLKIPTLESINFFGTKVTDAGVLKLSALPNLKRLYLWQTPVTPDAVKTLREKLPECEIITGS